MTAFEQLVREWTRPINGQYPRPWTSRSAAPEAARVFIVGRNQATAFPTSTMTRDEVVDALLGRGTVTLQDLYQRARAEKGGGPSRTRRNLDGLVDRLRARGIHDVLETNVVCYSTQKSSDLRRHEHREGDHRGRQIFDELLESVKPAVVIAHGAGTRADLALSLGPQVPTAPRTVDDGVRSALVPIPRRDAERPETLALVIAIPSLAPPGWNRWCRWAPGHLDAGIRQVEATLRP